MKSYQVDAPPAPPCGNRRRRRAGGQALGESVSWPMRRRWNRRRRRAGGQALGERVFPARMRRRLRDVEAVKEGLDVGGKNAVAEAVAVDGEASGKEAGGVGRGDAKGVGAGFVVDQNADAGGTEMQEAVELIGEEAKLL
ncbi:MAG: hypothetical protein PHR35_03390, partial [Kiritimatiellae bacterium]|nr:hypothetical protein [Kiritimatiellia bacterium]